MDAFATAIEDVAEPFAGVAGPYRRPRNLLVEQTYDDHASIHDDATAQKLGFKGGTIEGPTHFSQIAPLAVELFGEAWLARGSVSAHYRNAAFEGEAVRAVAARPAPGARIARVGVFKADGTEVLQGTVSIGPDFPPSALDERLAALKPLEDRVILRDVEVGMRSGRETVAMPADRRMGDLYPFSLTDKLAAITEPSPWYAGASPWGRPIVPFEMISVLCAYTADRDSFPVRRPVVGLFADQEIRLFDGPLFVGESYEIEREVVAMSGSRRTESLWVRTSIFRPGEATPAGEMLLNQAYLKESFPDYPAG